MPVELILANVSLFDSEVVGEEHSEFVGFEGGVLVLVVGFEDGLESLVDEFFDIEGGSLHWICYSIYTNSYCY